MPTTEVKLDRIATGGSAIGQWPDGRVVFVPGGLPGETVEVEQTSDQARWLEARLVRVIEAAAGRRQPLCSHVADQCGGCDWQHADGPTQVELRLAVVQDCMRRLAHLHPVEIKAGPELSLEHYRTSVRAGVVGGRAGYRMAATHDIIPVDQCVIAHPLVEEVLVSGYFGAATEITIRVGANTGERLVVVAPSLEVAGRVSVPDHTQVVGLDQAKAGDPRAVYHEKVGDVVYRISALSFFQCRADGAQVLVDAVGRGIKNGLELVGYPDSKKVRVLDAYSGVGLFSAQLGAQSGYWDQITAVESNRWAVADARHNLAAVANSSVVKSRIERWKPSPHDVVIADPARSGLKAQAAIRLAASDAQVMVLASCDPASLARDAKLITGMGYQLAYTEVLGMFANTSHLEAVSLFVKH